MGINLWNTHLFLLSPFILIGLLKRSSHKKILVTCYSLIITLIILLSSLTVLAIPERFAGLFTRDATVDLRARALTAAWPMAEDHSLFGVGYNLYQFSAQKAGLIDDFSIHSRAGTDNSYLTLWITTGLPGLILFLLPVGFLLVYFLSFWLNFAHAPALAVSISLVAWLVHANFINSLLYGHLLITFAIITSLALCTIPSSSFSRP